MNTITVSPEGAYPYLVLDDGALLKKCSVDTYAASGPGGQKRNRTYSAVRITHQETKLAAIGEESRSQLENKNRALKRLRQKMAFSLRKSRSEKKLRLHPDIEHLFQNATIACPNSKNPLYPLFCATILDFLFQAEGKLSLAAEALHSTTSQINKAFRRDAALLDAANAVREYYHLNRLK